MMQSFKNTKRKLHYFINADPRVMFFIIANLSLYAISIIVGGIETCKLALVVFVLCLLFIASQIFPNKRITRCFYLFPYCKRNYIYQYRTKKSLRNESETCQDILGYEVDNVIKKLPEGHYTSLTHEFLIVQLLMDDNIKLLCCEEAYEKNIHSLQDNMYGCKKCPSIKKNACLIRKKCTKSRRFYYIEFEKREEQSNPIR